MSLIEIAKEFATRKHEGQFRYDGVTPYIFHPLEVARRVENSVGAIKEEIAAALLHDVIEDTGATPEDLILIGMPNTVVLAVVLLTKKEGQGYMEYLEAVRRNSIARTVKVHDMLANLSDSPSKKQVKKYAEGLTFLLNGKI